MSDDLGSRPHRRRNPLTGRHVIVSPQRAGRPWQGQVEAVAAPTAPSHDPGCYLCPGNMRVSGVRNPDYRDVYLFDNDYPALADGSEPAAAASDPLFAAEPCRGVTRVLCYGPDHAASLSTLPTDAVAAVVDAWCGLDAELRGRFDHVQIFENRGAMMGASSPHPHGQVWATEHVPDEVLAEDSRQREFHARHGRTMLAEVAARELESGERIVVADPRWVAFVPFWASWPFETLVVPRFDAARLAGLAPDDRRALAELLGALTRRYDALFGTPFPYSMGWHGAPGQGAAPGWRVHAHFYPPLLRSATVRKFMVGYELLAETQRDLTPEEAAARLRAAGTDA